MGFLSLPNKVVMLGLIASLVAVFIGIESSIVLMFSIIIGFVAFIIHEISSNNNDSSNEEGEDI